MYICIYKYYVKIMFDDLITLFIHANQCFLTTNTFLIVVCTDRIIFTSTFG